MYIIRDIFHLHFGHYRDAKTLVDETRKKYMVPEAPHGKFKTHVRSSHREMLKEVM